MDENERMKKESELANMVDDMIGSGEWTEDELMDVVMGAVPKGTEPTGPRRKKKA